MSIKNLNPASLGTELQGGDQSPQARVIIRLSLLIERDVGVATNQNPSPRWELRQRRNRGDLSQAGFKGGKIVLLFNQFAAPILELFDGNRHRNSS